MFVYRDIFDRWASSRPVWNQPAYSVTNVGDHGEIPRTSDVAINWRTPGLNNFRQNVQGGGGLGSEALGVADLTSSIRNLDAPALVCSSDTSEATIHANICNRGRLAYGRDYVPLEYVREPAAGAALPRERGPAGVLVAPGSLRRPP